MNKQEKFIFKSINVHGERYDYSKVIYKGNKIPVSIGCEKHGYFEQRPCHHLRGSGCPVCSKNKKLNNQNIKIMFEDIHGQYYDYSKVEYKNMHTPVIIICPEHGDIYQLPLNHLRSKPDCCKKSKKDNLESFIQKSTKVHGKVYDYSLSVYKDSYTHLIITCKKHGNFLQTPCNHINKKQGCPICGNISRRLKRIEQISRDRYDGYQVIPSYSNEGCKILDKIMEKNGSYIQHALNGGEFYIKELGYWVDGYDKLNNIAYEFDEKHHFDKHGNLKKKDLNRQEEIEKVLNCKFIRIKKS